MQPVDNQFIDSKIQQLDKLTDAPVETQKLIDVFKNALRALQSKDVQTVQKLTEQYLDLRTRHAISPGTGGIFYSIADLSSLGRFFLDPSATLGPVAGQTTGTNAISGLVGVLGEVEKLDSPLSQGDAIEKLVHQMDLVFFHSAIVFGGAAYGVARQAAIFNQPHLLAQSSLLGMSGFTVAFTFCMAMGMRGLLGLNTDVVMEGVDVPFLTQFGIGTPKIDIPYIKAQLIGTLGEDLFYLNRLCKKGEGVNVVLERLTRDYHRRQYQFLKGKSAFRTLFSKETPDEEAVIEKLEEQAQHYWEKQRGIKEGENDPVIQTIKSGLSRQVNERLFQIIETESSKEKMEEFATADKNLTDIENLTPKALYGLFLFREYQSQIRQAAWSRYIGGDAVQQILVGDTLQKLAEDWRDLPEVDTIKVETGKSYAWGEEGTIPQELVLIPQELSLPQKPSLLESKIAATVRENRRTDLALVTLSLFWDVFAVIGLPLGVLVAGVAISVVMLYLDVPDMIARFREKGPVKSGDVVLATIQNMLALAGAFTTVVLLFIGRVALAITAPVLVPVAIMAVWLGVDLGYLARLVYRKAHWAEVEHEWQMFKTGHSVEKLEKVEEMARHKLDYFLAAGRIDPLQHYIYSRQVDVAGAKIEKEVKTIDVKLIPTQSANEDFLWIAEQFGKIEKEIQESLTLKIVDV